MSEMRMPVVFVGHGSPMNAIEDNRWSRSFVDLGRMLPLPRAVLCISAHWYVNAIGVTASAQPETIHDFGGFPRELFEVQYPAPGDPALAERIAGLVGGETREDWGIDHGAWSVLKWMYPDADIPVLQLSIDRRLSPQRHLELAARLRPLRDEGVLVVGSGNVVHNLRDAFQQMRAGKDETPGWAWRFDEAVTEALEERDLDTLAMMHASEDGRLSHPTLDHWLPLLYAVGASDADDSVSFPITGFDWGSLSMRALRFDTA